MVSAEVEGDVLFFFFNDTATTEIYTLSLHDALPICWIWPHPGRTSCDRPAKLVVRDLLCQSAFLFECERPRGPGNACLPTGCYRAGEARPDAIGAASVPLECNACRSLASV